MLVTPLSEVHGWFLPGLDLTRQKANLAEKISSKGDPLPTWSLPNPLVVTPDSGSRNTFLFISPLWQSVGSALSLVCWAGTGCILMLYKDSLGISMFLHWWDTGKVMSAFVCLSRVWVVAGWLKHKVCYGEIDYLKTVQQWKPLEGRRQKITWF